MNKKVKTPKNGNIKKCKTCGYITGDHQYKECCDHASCLYEAVYVMQAEENKNCPSCGSRLVKATAEEVLTTLGDAVKFFKAECKKTKNYLTGLEQLELNKLTARFNEVKKLVEGE